MKKAYIVVIFGNIGTFGDESLYRYPEASSVVCCLVAASGRAGELVRKTVGDEGSGHGFHVWRRLILKRGGLPRPPRRNKASQSMN
jgi:hypothetical protein